MKNQNKPSRGNSSDEEDTLQELLGVAVRAEIEAAEIYRNLLDRDLPEKTREKVESLVSQEENHEEEFWSIIEDFYPQDKISLPESSGLSNPVEIDEGVTLEKLFQTAMTSEKESEKFYQNLMERFEEKEVRRTLGFLAASEREHYEILKEELQKLDLE